MPQAAPVPPVPGSARRKAFAMERLEHAFEAVDRALVVRVPPGNGDAAGVVVDDLDVRELVETVLAVHPAVATPLRAAPRRARAVRPADVVRPHHSDVETGRDPPRTVSIARPH